MGCKDWCMLRRMVLNYPAIMVPMVMKVCHYKEVSDFFVTSQQLYRNVEQVMELSAAVIISTSRITRPQLHNEIIIGGINQSS